MGFDSRLHEHDFGYLYSLSTCPGGLEPEVGSEEKTWSTRDLHDRNDVRLRLSQIGTIQLIFYHSACIASILSLVYKARLVHNTDTLWNSYKVDILNIVEMNVAIMVASMPACASLFRYISSQSSLLSSMKSSLFSSGVSARTSKPPHGAQKQDKVSSDGHIRNGQHKFWRLRGTSDLESVPPQITSVKTQSGRVLETWDMDVVDDKTLST